MHILASGLSLSFSGSLLVAALLQLGSECFAGAAANAAAAAAPPPCRNATVLGVIVIVRDTNTTAF